MLEVEMKQNDGGPAFPHDITKRSDAYGMTLRDYFAAKAMQGVLANGMSKYKVNGTAISGADTLAICAYTMADAMLAEREK
jgi:hypothetical protein